MAVTLTPTSFLTDPRSQWIKYIVEATDCEMLYLWNRYQFKQDGSGWMVHVGDIDGGRPVNMAVFFIHFGDRCILIWDAVSQVVDFKLIDEFFEAHFPGVGRTNAMNFHNAIRDDIPRNQASIEAFQRRMEAAKYPKAD